MGATGKEFLEIRERYLVTIDKEYYKEHYDILCPPNTDIRAVYVDGEDHKGDARHTELLKAYLKAQKALRDYEYEKRYGL